MNAQVRFGEGQHGGEAARAVLVGREAVVGLAHLFEPESQHLSIEESAAGGHVAQDRGRRRKSGQNVQAGDIIRHGKGARGKRGGKIVGGAGCYLAAAFPLNRGAGRSISKSAVPAPGRLPIRFTRLRFVS